MMMMRLLLSWFLTLNIFILATCAPLDENDAINEGSNAHGLAMRLDASSNIAKHVRHKRIAQLQGDETDLTEIEKIVQETTKDELDVIYLEDPDDNGGEKTIQDEPPEEQYKPGMDDLFESDIHLSPAQAEGLRDLIAEEGDDGGDDRMIKRKGIGNLANRWPEGIVPYKINESISDPSGIQKAMAHWEYHTCIRFVPQTEELIEEIGHADHISVQKGDGFWSYVGRVGLGPQTVSIGDESRVGSIGHELGHAIGFWHEQARPDRDDYITIAFENVREGFEDAFKKYDAEEVAMHDIPYDVNSIMHYGAYYFSKNNMPTIVAKNEEDQDKLGNRNSLSKHDILLANAMYECPDATHCFDKSATCEQWARNGFCKEGRYVGYMIGNCPKSCDICHECVDRHVHCNTWAKTGFCTNPKYMVIVTNHCKKSCNICTELSAPEE